MDAAPYGSSQLSHVELRRAERHDVSFAAVLTTPSGGIRVQVVNISRTGFMVRADDQVAERTETAIDLPMVGPRKSRTVWCLGGRIGGEFVEPIDPATFAVMIEAARRLRPAWPA